MDTTIVRFLLEHEERDKDKIYLRQPREGKWHEYTWGEVVYQARMVAGFLQAQGLKRGAHIAIYSKNCAEWFITDFGISLAGMVNVPLFANQHEDSIHYVLKHSEVELIFVGKLDKHEEARSYLPDGITTVSFDYHPDLETDHRWADVLAGAPLQEIVHPGADDIYTIIYSSGTSGTPKGAVYTHEIIARYLKIFPEDIKRLADLNHYHLLSYLPLAHVYERSAIQLGSLAIPCDVSFVENLDVFADNLRDVKPTLFAAVPRVWGVFQHKIEQKLSPHLLKILLNIPILGSIIRKKVSKQLGLSESKANISGAAHLPLSIYNFFRQLDIPIQEGYGQTENLAYATLTLPDEIRAGYVGSPRLQVEIKKGEGDELLIKSPCVMKEYYKDSEATASAFTKDGWLHTGDMVEIDSLQRVKIIGRLSENFKNQKGEFVAPTPIEKLFASNALIENLCLVGRELSRNVLLVTLSEAAENKSQEEIKNSLRQTLHQVNPELKSYEKVSHVLIVKDNWNIENNFLTPTLKVRRRLIEEHYQDFIQPALEQSDAVIWEN